MNIGDLFDSPLKIAIIAVVIIVLFGSKKLPHAARSLGQSMRILKREVQGLHDDEPGSGASDEAPAGASAAMAAPAELTAVPQPDHQAQIDALQQQVRDLQRAAAMDPPAQAVPTGAAAETPRTQRPT
jgi:sec-independent protein translocase protein TatA